MSPLLRFILALSYVLASMPVLAASPDVQLDVQFTADRISVSAGETVTLSWHSTGARRCVASGAWDGRKSLEGTYTSAPLSTSVPFILTCKRRKHSITQELYITVTRQEAEPPVADNEGESPPEDTTDGTSPSQPPTVTIFAHDSEVTAEGITTLEWQTLDADVCEASGGWSGAKPVEGTQTVGPLTSTSSYTLTCANPAGESVAMISVVVVKSHTIEWIQPTHNQDGTLIEGISFFRIYKGNESRVYDHTIDVSGGSTTYTVTGASGSHFIAMSAIDTSGVESDFSNEVQVQF